MSFQKAMEKEFIELEEGKMSFLQYTSMVMDLSLYAPAYVAYKTLKMSWFELGLNHELKVAMPLWTYNSYKEMHDATIQMERAQNEREAFFNK